MDDDVRAAYTRWKSKYLAQAGTELDGQPRYRVKLASAATSATVSEGQGYGMLIVALMAGDDADAQRLFDGLWEYFNDHRSPIDSRLMDWHVPPDETAEPGNDDSAFDGDADIAFGLLLADQQWGSAGRVNYRREAGEVMAGVLASEIGPQSRLPMFGDWVQPNDDPYNQYTPRSSDFMPDHFRAFARASGDATWNAVVVACQESVASLQANYSPVTGLLPDFIVPVSATDHTPKPAPAGFLEDPNDGYYYFNAGRDPWRLGTDALINGDAPSTSQTLRMARWIRSATGGIPQNIKPGYQLDGTPLLPGDYFTSFFAAPFGVAAMLAPEQQSWLNDVYDAVHLREEGYYEDTITLLCMLVMTHNYWDPTHPPQAASLGTAFFLR
ncbi:MAG: glycosyl hydrolase family 8 [bacterium]